MRRSGRPLRTLALLGATATAVGICSAAAPPSTVAAAETSTAAATTERLGSPVAGDASRLRLELPRGYGTVAGRAAQAVEAAAAAAAAAEAPLGATSGAPAGAAGQAERRSSTPSVTTPGPASSTGLPLGIEPGASEQVVTVVAASARSTSAQLTAWRRGPIGWTAVLGPVTARIGAAGVGQASESSTRTPAGTFPLTEAFGRAGDPGTALPYRVVDGDDWWVGDVDSPRYNQYAECGDGECDFDEQASENLYAAGGVYDHAIVIDYNRDGTPGAGSAFFLHVSNGAPTAGCVSIDARSMVTLLRWLNPAARPVIAIGVG